MSILPHYSEVSEVIMGAMVSQITSLAIVYSTVLFRRRSKKTSKLRVTGLCAGNSPVTGEFPAQMVSNAENDSIWWRHRAGDNDQFEQFAIMFEWFNVSRIMYKLGQIIQPISITLFQDASLCRVYNPIHEDVIKWKRFSASLVLCAGNSPVTGEFPSQRPVTQSFDVFFDLRLKQSWGWWFETPLRSLWRHCNVRPPGIITISIKIHGDAIRKVRWCNPMKNPERQYCKKIVYPIQDVEILIIQ